MTDSDVTVIGGNDFKSFPLNKPPQIVGKMSKAKQILIQRIDRLYQKGTDKLENQEYLEAIGFFIDALHRIPIKFGKNRCALEVTPENKNFINASILINSAIADCYFELKFHKEAKKFYEFALDYPLIKNEINATPYYKLKLGICEFHLKNFKDARLYLQDAHYAFGDDIFGDVYPKYLKWLLLPTTIKANNDKVDSKKDVHVEDEDESRENQENQEKEVKE